MNPIRTLSTRLPAALALGVLWLAPGAAAQNIVLDEGEFRVTVRGLEVGRETFSIHRMGSGADAKVIASGEVELGARQMRPLLETTPDLFLTAYQVKVSGDETLEVYVKSNGSRLVAVRGLAACGTKSGYVCLLRRA